MSPSPVTAISGANAPAAVDVLQTLKILTVTTGLRQLAMQKSGNFPKSGINAYR
jgi:hypothetical protein